MRRDALPAVLAALTLFGCEPAFIEQCRRECECTGDSFACTLPRSGGCDNAWRREWALASQGGCEGPYVAWFNCVHASSTCRSSGGEPRYDAPESACQPEASQLRECCSDDKCDD